MLQSVNMSVTAVKSMQAIDDWMDTINANLNGIGKTAFKESEISFGGNITYTLRTPRQDMAGEMVGEQALTVGNTKINWKQGTIVSSTQDQHLAIQGEGFFAVINPEIYAGDGFIEKNPATGDLEYNAGGTFMGKAYLTRDGEFEWRLIPSISATDPILVTKEGFLVFADIDDAGGTNGNSDNVYAAVYKSQWDNPSVKSRPSVVMPTYEISVLPPAPTNLIAVSTSIEPSIFTDLQQLKYSVYGSTYYEAPTAGSAKTIVNGSNGNLDKFSPASTFNGTRLLEKAIEASNTSTERNITHLSMLGKIYNGFVQLIKVYNSNTDEVLGFIR